MNTLARHALSLFGALALAAAPSAAQAQPAAARQTQRIDVIAAAATLHPRVRDAFTAVDRAVQERTQGAVQIRLVARPGPERDLLRRLDLGQAGGVVLSQEALVEACPGALALRTPRELSPEAFDRGLAAVRQQVAGTCAFNLEPAAWFSTGQRLLFAGIRALPDGGVGAPLRVPADLAGYSVARFDAEERRAFGLTPFASGSPLSLQSAHDFFLADADVPGDRATRSMLLARFGHALGVVALSRAARDALSPQQRAAVDDAFVDLERGLTASFRRDEQAAVHEATLRAQLAIEGPGDWARWATEVEARIRESRRGAAPILDLFLASAATEPGPRPPQRAAAVEGVTAAALPTPAAGDAGAATAPADAAAPADATAPTEDAAPAPRQPTVTLSFEGVPASVRQGDYESVMQREVPPRAMVCYERILRLRPDAQARVTVRLSVRGDGSVAFLGWARVTTETQTPDTAWTNCLRDAVRQLRVAPPAAPTEPFEQVVDYSLR